MQFNKSLRLTSIPTRVAVCKARSEVPQPTSKTNLELQRCLRQALSVSYHSSSNRERSSSHLSLSLGIEHVFEPPVLLTLLSPFSRADADFREFRKLLLLVPNNLTTRKVHLSAALGRGTVCFAYDLLWREISREVLENVRNSLCCHIPATCTVISLPNVYQVSSLLLVMGFRSAGMPPSRFLFARLVAPL